MVFEVLISDEAYADLDMLAGEIRRRSTPDIARKWFSSLIAAIDSLASMPERCATAPESALLGSDVTRAVSRAEKPDVQGLFPRATQWAIGGSCACVARQALGT